MIKASSAPLEFVSILISLFFFGAGAISDLKTREVADKVWLAYGTLGLILTSIRILSDSSLFLSVGISIGLSTLIAVGLSKFGILGGADAKALICLALTTSLSPGILHPWYGYAHPFFPITVIQMAFVYSGSVALWILGKNVAMHFRLHAWAFYDGLRDEPMWRKVLAIITGYPTGLKELKSRFYLCPMEEFVQIGGHVKRRFSFPLNAQVDRAESLSRLDNSLRKNLSEDDMQKTLVWSTPELPMLFFILMSFLATLIIGDPIFGNLVAHR